MTLFPITKLPAPAWEPLSHNWSFADLFKMSICSKQCARLFSFGRLQISSLCVEVSSDNKIHCSLSVNKFSVFFHFQNRSEHEEFSIRKTINDVDFELDVRDEYKYTVIYAYCHDVTSGTKAILTHLLSFMLLPTKTLTLQIQKNCDIVKELLKFNSVRRAKNFQMDARGSSWSTVKMVLSSLKSLKTVSLENSPMEEGELPPFRNLKSISLHGKGWVSKESFFGLNCERIHLDDPILSEDDINEYLKTWQKNCDGRLQLLEIMWNEPIDMEKVLKGLDAEVWDKNRRDKHYLLDQINDFRVWLDCGDGHDIVRSDGMLGTVLHGCQSFRFLVWRERFPTKRIPAQILDPHFSGLMGFNNA